MSKEQTIFLATIVFLVCLGVSYLIISFIFRDLYIMYSHSYNLHTHQALNNKMNLHESCFIPPMPRYIEDSNRQGT